MTISLLPAPAPAPVTRNGPPSCLLHVLGVPAPAFNGTSGDAFEPFDAGGSTYSLRKILILFFLFSYFLTHFSWTWRFRKQISREILGRNSCTEACVSVLAPYRQLGQDRRCVSVYSSGRSFPLVVYELTGSQPMPQWYQQQLWCLLDLTLLLNKFCCQINTFIKASLVI